MQLPRATRLVVRIAGKRMYPWRAVDDEGEVLDMLVQRRRDSRAALRLMRKLLKKQGFAPKLLVTDKLRSYASAFRRLRLSCPHEQGLRSNNRAENSHQPVRPPKGERCYPCVPPSARPSSGGAASCRSITSMSRKKTATGKHPKHGLCESARWPRSLGEPSRFRPTARRASKINFFHANIDTHHCRG
jgi:transposase-like protein